MFARLVLFGLSALGLIAVGRGQSFAVADTLEIVVVAGQSNALSFRSGADDFVTDSIDAEIPFYYYGGMPTNHFSNSDDEWTTLGMQKQTAFDKFDTLYYGPEIALGRRLRREGVNVAVMKFAYGGADLAVEWSPSATTGPKLYEATATQITLGLSRLDDQGVPYRFVGYFWMQGESDAANESYANAYRENLMAFVSAVRRDLGNNRLPFVLGRIGNASSYDYKEIVRAEQVAGAEDVAYCAWVDTDDLPLADDNIHYIEPGVSELGERWAEAWRDIADPSAVHKTDAPSGWALEQNYPNPFNPSTTVEFRLAKPGRVSLVAYDVLGRKVATLWNGAARRGRTRVSFDGGKLAAGTYLVRLVTDGGSETIKATLVK